MALSPALLALLVDRINVGVLTVGLDLTVTQWNRFLQAHSGVSAEEIVGRNLCDVFPALDRAFIERKVRGVALLKSFAFSSWQQRPYLFRFQNHRPLTLDAEPMRQDCAFIPLMEGGAVTAVSIVLTDATDTYESQTRLDQALAALAAQSERDALTGIYNRRKLAELAEAELKRARRYGDEVSLLIFDIDHFKQVNDRFGHPAGDEAIRHVAQRALKTLRETDTVARWGGEEFVALLPKVGLAGATVAAERVRRAVAESPVVTAVATIQVTISLGVTSLRAAAAGADLATLVAEADSALYRSKHEGRNRTTAFSPGPPREPQAQLPS